MRDNKSYYDTFSETYDAPRDHGYHRYLDEAEVDVVRPWVTGKEVLEVGCGTGLILERLAGLAERAVGVDLSPGMLEHARARGLDVHEASATALPFEDECFDAAVSFKVLAHVPPIQEAIDELVRVTRPGGKLALEFYNPWSLRYLMKRVRPGRISATVKEDAVFTRWDSVGQVMDMAPPGVKVDCVHGVRVFTPFAQMHQVPLLGSALGLMERWALRSPLRWFGGFVIVVLSKDAD